MPMVLTPIATLLDIGRGVLDLDAALTQATFADLVFYNDGNVVLFISNASAGVRTVTVKSQQDPFSRGGAADTQNDEVIAITAGKIGFIPFMNPAMFNLGGMVTVTLDAVATTKVGIYRLTKAR